MLLDRIDIDAHGPLHRVELGPFTEQLNTVCGPEGSGKTAIARFIRDSLVSRDYPLGMLSSSSGGVVWADRNGLVHCRREKDGTANGRRTVEFESRGDVDRHFGSLEHSWISGVSASSDSSRAIRSIELPEWIVDGVVTDATVTSVFRVVSACLKSGLDSHPAHRSAPLGDESIYHDRHGFVDTADRQSGRHEVRAVQLNEELSDVESELARVGDVQYDREALVVRRNQLTARLAHPYRTKAATNQYDGSQHADWRQQLTQLHDRARRLRSRQNELRRWIADIDSDSRRRARYSDHPDSPHAGTRRRELDDRQRSESIAELDRVTSELDACLSQAVELRRSMRSHPYPQWCDNRNRYDWIDRDALAAELRRVDDRIASASRVQWLRSRRSQLLEQLRFVSGPARTKSPLADAARGWLARLSAGRLQRVDWSPNQIRSNTNSLDRDTHQPAGVTIDDRDETECPAVDRALAAMAVRLAAGDLLASTGRHVPLVFETHGEMFANAGSNPIAAALADYAQRGRQIVVLTSNQDLTAQLSRFGARAFQVHAQRLVHARRPIWQPHYEAEQYTGPHPDLSQGSQRRAQRPLRPDVDINRDFDMAWREAYGYYGANESFTHPLAESVPKFKVSGTAPPRSHTPTSPFFLSVDSPIDQAPSIDAVAAARLRGLDVTHVTHLMQHDPNRLADALGLASVEAATIRRWQAECRLVCRVPQLRGFDARVLIGCGVTTPEQLASIHPGDLLKEVEAFLATRRGQQIMLSGSSHELSRITSWIAAANSSTERGLAQFGSGDGDENELQLHRHSLQSRRRIIRTMNERDAANNSKGRSDPRRSNREDRDATRDRRSSQSGNERDRPADRKRRRRRTDASSETPKRDVVRYKREREVRVLQQPTDTNDSRERRKREDDSQPQLQFYLHRESPIVDAPAIGSRMAERLGAIKIDTVDDLLNADPENVAGEMGHRRVDADIVAAWQQQATLVCCVPMLRGHDAQLLVAAEVTTPEELALCDADELFGIIDLIARSGEGKRIIRGGDLPDLEEVTNWISYAQHKRNLIAA